MSNHVGISWKKIVLWGVLSVVVGLIVFQIDLYVQQRKTIFFLSNYSDIVLVVWQVQASVSSLTVAVTAFIIGKIDTSYYGICARELLYIPRKLPSFFLSFWEMIIYSIILILLSWGSLIISNIAVATFMLIVSIFFTVQIVVECINVITKAEYFIQFAKDIVNRKIEVILENPFNYDIWMHTQDGSQREWKPTESQRKSRSQFISIIKNINTEISQKISKQISLIDDQTFLFFIRTMNTFDEHDEAEICNIMFNYLSDWIRQTIYNKDERNIQNLVAASYSTNKNREQDGISILLAAYYEGTVNVSIFKKRIDDICITLQQAFPDNTVVALTVIRYSIYHADVDTFTKVIKAAYQIGTLPQSRAIKGKVLVVAFAYLYYISLREPRIVLENGQLYINKLRDFMKVTLFEESNDSRAVSMRNAIEDTKSIFMSFNFLMTFFENRQNNWEYMPIGTVKRMHLMDDIKEFMTFYCMTYYTRDCDMALNTLTLDVLLCMKENAGNAGHYEEFCNWLRKSEHKVNPKGDFLRAITGKIKEKLLFEANEIRKDTITRREKLSKFKEQIQHNLEESKLFRSSICQDSSDHVIRFKGHYFLKSFSKHVSLFGAENVIRATLEHSLFERISNSLEEYSVDFIDSDNIALMCEIYKDILDKLTKRGIHVDNSFNYDFGESTRYMQVTPELTNKIMEITDRITNIGQWDCGGFCTVYVDSSKMNVGFSVSEQGFMTVYEELSDEEIDEEIDKYKDESGYFFKEHSNSSEIEYTRDELRAFLKIAMFKIVFSFPISVPRETIGFYTTEKQTDIE